MLPLSYAEVNETNVIKKVTGNPEMKKHLEDMGFVTGAVITVVSTVNGNLIVNIKDTKVALDKQLICKNPCQVLLKKNLRNLSSINTFSI